MRTSTSGTTRLDLPHDERSRAHALVERRGALGDGVPAELALDARAAGDAHALADLGMFGEPRDRAREGARIARRDEQSGLAVAHGEADAADGGADDGP